jgi:beta-N-acetylhexosaminidase
VAVRRSLLALSIALIAASLVVALVPVREAEARAAAVDVDKLLSRMSLREKIGQLVMFRVGGHSLSQRERDLIRDLHLGGVILFADNYKDRAQVTELNRRIQVVMKRASGHWIGALISVDQEGGVVKRFPDMAPSMSAPEIGDTGKESVAFDQGRATGRDLSSVGVNIDLAPVADLDLPPEHVMRSRSFGANRFLVGKLVRGFAEGLQRKRVAATAKHFPGLGGATINSDDGKAYVRRSKWKLRHIDATPFHRAINAGIKLVMLSHAIYPKDGGQKPASINRHIATDRLRKGFGFKGVAISDDLGAVSWRFGGDVPKSCPVAIRAGNDIALLARDIDTAVPCAQAIYRAVRQDKLSKHRIDQATRRVLRLKSWLGLL